jgi:hypothetical protein
MRNLKAEFKTKMKVSMKRKNTWKEQSGWERSYQMK